MKRLSRILFLAIICMADLIFGQLRAAPVVIANYSFEEDIVPRDGSTATAKNATDDYNTDIVPFGWTGFDDSRGGTTGNRGLLSAASDSFFSATLANTPDDDTNDQTFFTAARDIYQVLSTTLQSNTTYTLTVNIGCRSGYSPGTPAVNFGAGATPGTNLLAADSSEQPATVDGSWVTWTFTYTTDSVTEGIGQPLRIELTTGSAVSWFDNVHLEADSLDGSSIGSDLKLAIKLSDSGIHLSWPSRSNAIYNVISSNDLTADSTGNWPAYSNYSEIKSTPPVNSLMLYAPQEDPVRFFAISESKPRIKVFLLGGQSNMRGSYTEIEELPSALQGAQDDVLFYYGAGLQSLQPGSGSVFGPEITFGRDVADAFTNETFALIKYAVGGTSLEDHWDLQTGSTYSTFRNVVEVGLNALSGAGYETEIVGMLWTQGERDARDGYGSAYETNLTAFISDIRSRYGTDLPFYISQLSTLQTNLPSADLALVREAQANVTAADTNSFLIVTDSFDMGSDDLHFTGAGQMALGSAFAAACEDL